MIEQIDGTRRKQASNADRRKIERFQTPLPILNEPLFISCFDSPEHLFFSPTVIFFCAKLFSATCRNRVYLFDTLTKAAIFSVEHFPLIIISIPTLYSLLASKIFTTLQHGLSIITLQSFPLVSMF